MTTSTLPISRLIAVSVILSPLAAQSQSLSTMLILGTSDIIDVSERQRTYTTLAEVAGDFPTTSAEYLAAQPWFAQAPQPENLKIGRWAKTATSAVLRGGPMSTTAQAIALFNAVTTPAFSMYIAGLPVTVSPASFATATNLNGIATLIQTALQVVDAGATVVYNSVYSRFEFEDVSNTGATSTYSFLTAPTAFGSVLFSVNPTANDTITLAGTVITFKASGATGNQVNIGGSLAVTLASLLTFLNASTDTNLVKLTYSLNSTPNTLYVRAVATGTAGNALTLAASAATASGTTLSGGSGTDISALIFGQSTQGGYVANGIAAETALASVVIQDNMFGQAWYGLVIPQAVTADHLAVAGFIQGATNKHVYGVTTQDTNVLNAAATSDVAYQLQQLGYTRTMVQYSSSSLYAVSSLMARAITVNYNGTNTVINLFYKQEPGITPETLNTTQITALEAKNCNVFVTYNNNTSIIERGMMAGGQFIDVITGSDWLAVTLQTAWYNLLYTSTTKIPQTDAGMHLFVVVAESILSQAVLNGLLAPGVWQQAGFGALNQGDFMPKGFYVYAPPVATQLSADRAARKSVAFQIACQLAGAVDTVNVSITFGS